MKSDIGQKQLLKYPWWKHVKQSKSVQFDRPFLLICNPYPLHSLSQLSFIEASPAWNGSCGVHHRGARLQRPFRASGRPWRTTRLGEQRKHMHTFICISVFFVSDNHFCPYSFNCIYYFYLKILNICLKKKYPHSESKTLALRPRYGHICFTVNTEAHK